MPGSPTSIAAHTARRKPKATGHMSATPIHSASSRSGALQHRHIRRIRGGVMLYPDTFRKTGEDSMADLKADFAKAQKDVKTLSKRPDNNDMLFLYAHFKQASEGDVSGSRPGMLDMVGRAKHDRSEEHTSELQSLMRISYAVFCLKKKNTDIT